MKFTDRPPTEPGLWWCALKSSPNPGWNDSEWAAPFVVEVSPAGVGSCTLDYLLPGRELLPFDFHRFIWGDRLDLPEVEFGQIPRR